MTLSASASREDAYDEPAATIGTSERTDRVTKVAYDTQVVQRAHDRSEAFARQINEAAINGANFALRMVLLINGGAALALLTFVGGLPAEQKRAIAATLDWFTWGVAAAVAGLACAYFRITA